MGNRLAGRLRRGAGMPCGGPWRPGGPPGAPASKGPPVARSAASTGWLSGYALRVSPRGSPA